MHHSTATPAHTGKPTTLAPHPAHRSPALPEVEHPTTGTTTPPALVTTGIKPNGGETAEVKTLSTRQRAGRRQEVMWAITEDKDLAGCHRWARGGEVGLSWSSSGPSSYVGLQNTGSRWGSPLAENEIMRERRVELGLAVKNWLASGGSVVMAVGTVRHKRSQSAEQVVAGLQSAYASMVDTPKWRSADRKHYGIAEIFTDYEYTWSPANGHHPHKNMLLFVDKSLSALELEALGDSMFGRWSAGAVKAGLEAPTREHGLKLEQVTTWGADAALAAVYLAKGMAAEFTGAATKEAYGESLTAFQMLDVMADQRDAGEGFSPMLVAVYREYGKAFKGLRSSWSRGAKKALGVDFITEEQREQMLLELERLTGEEQDREPEAERFVVAGVPSGGKGAEWSKIMSNMSARERVLQAVEGARSRAEAQRNALVMLAEFNVVAVPRMVSMDGPGLDAVMSTHVEAWSRDLRRAVLAE